MSQIIVKRRTERDTFSPIHGAEEVRKETSTHVSHLRCLSRSRRLGSQAAKGRMFLTWQTVSRSQSRDQGSRIARQMEMGFLSLMPFPFQTSVRPLIHSLMKVETIWQQAMRVQGWHGIGEQRQEQDRTRVLHGLGKSRNARMHTSDINDRRRIRVYSPSSASSRHSILSGSRPPCLSHPS